LALNPIERNIASGLLLLLALFCLSTTMFVVEEAEHAVTLRFGRAVAVHDTPGLKLKWPPPIEQVRRYDRRVLYQAIPRTEFLTADKKNVLVSSFLTWRIVSAQKFMQALNTREAAETRLETLTKSALGAALGNRPFTDFIPDVPGDESAEDSTANLQELEQQVFDNAGEVARNDFGIEIEAFGVSRFSFPEQNLLAVFARMRAERERIAEAYRSEGEADARKIVSGAERQRAEIVAEAEAEAEILRGRAEAEAAKIYADAYSEHEAFYEFLRTLETYEKVITKDTTIIVPANSPLLDLLTGGAGGK
jgi:modulator of FtsH protease HflC